MWVCPLSLGETCLVSHTLCDRACPLRLRHLGLPRAAATNDSEVRLTHAGGDQITRAATRRGHRDGRGCCRASSSTAFLKQTHPAVMLLTSSSPHEMRPRGCVCGRRVRGAWVPEGTHRPGQAAPSGEKQPLLLQPSLSWHPHPLSTTCSSLCGWNLKETSGLFQLGPRGRMKSYKEWCE